VKNGLRAAAIGIAVYLLILLATFPVTRLTGSLEQQLDGVLLRGVSGTLWSGQADHLSVQGNDIGPVHWRIRPLRLLTGNLEYRVELPGKDNPGSALLDLSFGGRLHGRDLDLQMPPGELINRFSPIRVVAGGTLHLQLESFALPGKSPATAQGELSWQGAQLSEPLQLELGDIAFGLANAGDNLVATVTEGGTLGLSGNVTLQPAGNYAVNLALQPGPGVGAEVRDMLDSFMSRRPGGGYQIVAAGKL
jgi:general secretion pathway protein N